MFNLMLPMRLWIALTGLMAIMQACQCFLGNFSFIAEKIYVLQPDQVTPLAARLFGTWIALAGGIRLGCGYNIYNEHLFIATIFSYLLAFVHFVTELTFYQTSSARIGVVLPIAISGGTVMMMLIGYPRIVKANRERSRHRD